MSWRLADTGWRQAHQGPAAARVAAGATLEGVLDGRSFSAARLLLPAGTAAAPPLALGADANDGLYQISDTALGLAIEGLTAGKLAAADVFTQNITAAGDRIALNGSRAQIILVRTNCPGGAITLTSTPNIDAGAFDGQILLIEQDKDTSGGLTFSDESGVPGSGMRLVGATLANNARDVLTFIWSVDSSAWIQVHARLNVL